MSYFTTDQANALAAADVRIATLAVFDFASGVKRYHNGFGGLTLGGNDYDGLGEIATIEGLEETRSAESHAVTVRASGVDATFLAKALAETSEVDGRVLAISGQLFDADLAPIGDPLLWWAGYMQPPRIERSEPDEFSNATQAVSITAENIFYGRHRPPAGRYTDREQQNRFPGDRFCERVAELVSKTINWPDY